jgi:hypothetical protein
MKVNTTSSVGGVEEAPRSGDTRGGQDAGHVNTSHILEPPLMTYIDDPDPEITQSLEAAGYYAVTNKDGVYEATPVDTFLVFSDGSLFGADEEGEDLAEVKGFRGYVFIAGGADGLDSDDIEQLLNETMINEEDDNG